MIEITETAAIQRTEEASRTASELQALGVRICLDDFGAGNADLRMMRELRPNVVKLDGSYVRGIDGHERERAMVSGIVEVARATGAHIVAESIETEAEAATVMQLGVEFGQGWLFARPGPLPALRSPEREAVRTPAPRPRRRSSGDEMWE